MPKTRYIQRRWSSVTVRSKLMAYQLKQAIRIHTYQRREYRLAFPCSPEDTVTDSCSVQQYNPYTQQQSVRCHKRHTHTLDTMRKALCMLIIVRPSRSSPRNRAAQRRRPLQKVGQKKEYQWLGQHQIALYGTLH